MSFQSLEPGRLVADKYRIRSWLGQGGMGTVYLVESVASGELLALKELALPHHPGAARQFRREVELLARLQHPALVQPRDFFEWGERLYFAMEYVDGCTLSQVIKAGPLPLDMALDCARQLCSVLECLHRQNPPILYRDLKPSNIMIDSQHRVRLIDFGIARCLEQGEETTTFLRGMGSAGYAPLEQYGEQGGTDERSDIYSLGATLYSVLTGKVPESPITRVSETGALTSLRLYNAKIPRLLESVILRMMSLKKEGRYRDVSQAWRALEAAFEGQSPQDPETEALPTVRPFQAAPSPSMETSRPSPAVPLFLTALAVLLVMPYFAYSDRVIPLQWLSLPFHWLGHILAIPLGERGCAWGGPVLQLLAPLLVTLSLLWSARWKAACWAGLWASSVLVTLGTYAGDARLGKLVVAGEEDNDWRTILGGLRLLSEAPAIGARLQLVGRVALASCLLAWLWLVLRELLQSSDWSQAGSSTIDSN